MQHESLVLAGMAHDVHRFDEWAATYERHFFQRLIFDPVHRTLLSIAVSEVPDAHAILDVGCGTGRLLRAAEKAFPQAALVGVDAAEGMVRQAAALVPVGSRIHFQQAVAERLPFPDGRFDLVFSTLTFHHWSDQRAGIGEVARVMPPGGRWLLADFVASGLMKYVRRLFRLRRFPERRVIDPMLASAGLHVASQHRVTGVGSQVPVLVIRRL
jgi:ubiquinone/menaquinone biosynthesis C-methylase UbiE